ncbi:MAG: radical SAM protein [Nitrospiraceae bacterium]|nr:MAG: radical SAM protein [Nitrospiraceae bacterium]
MSINNSFDFFVQWHLTERCNLNCTHCYQTGKKTHEMTLPEIKETITEITDTLNIWMKTYGISFTPSVNLTGGEPFLKKDIFTIIDEFRIRDFEIFLLTNGTLVDADMAKRLYALDIKGVQVSIEGPKKIHESIRGRGSFSDSLRGVSNLLEAGLDVTLNVTLSYLNAGHFMDLFNLSSALGVQKLGFSRLVPSGRGEALVTEMLKTEEVKDLYDNIFSLNTNSLEIVTGDPVASQLRRGTDDRDCGDIALGGCAAGISGLTILPDGTLLPCRRLPVPIGNILKDSLREIWAASEVLNALRDRSMYKGRCGSCRKWAHCRGCRAIAYAYSNTQGQGDFLAPDPQCFFNQ